MKRIIPVNLWLILVIGSLSLLTFNSAQCEYEDVIEKSFNVNPGGKLTVDTERGSIEISTQPGNQVAVKVYREVDKGDQEDAEEILKDFQVNFTQQGNDVQIKAEFKTKKSSFWDSDRRHLKVRFRITVPKQYHVDLTTSGGSISVDDLQGEVKSKTSGGSLHFGQITGPVMGRTSGGSIELLGCKGKAEVKTSGGSIKIGEVAGEVQAYTSGGSIHIDKAQGNVEAHTSGGSVKVAEVMGTINASTSGGSVSASISKQPAHDCSLETSGGSVTVQLAEKIGVNVDAKTSGGRVITEFPITVQGEISKHELEAKVNGGGPNLILRTSGGNIYLKKM
ncbi:DUF4097 domain-containing protein [candidate division KSB1 bacterium]|nr:DUF4097 domain-containing protein [candidate division KSB1 bacterium]